jgi:hypothetical protein
LALAGQVANAQPTDDCPSGVRRYVLAAGENLNVVTNVRGIASSPYFKNPMYELSLAISDTDYCLELASSSVLQIRLTDECNEGASSPDSTAPPEATASPDGSCETLSVCDVLVAFIADPKDGDKPKRVVRFTNDNTRRAQVYGFCREMNLPYYFYAPADPLAGVSDGATGFSPLELAPPTNLIVHSVTQESRSRIFGRFDGARGESFLRLFENIRTQPPSCRVGSPGNFAQDLRAQLAVFALNNNWDLVSIFENFYFRNNGTFSFRSISDFRCVVEGLLGFSLESGVPTGSIRCEGECPNNQPTPVSVLVNIDVSGVISKKSLLIKKDGQDTALIELERQELQREIVLDGAGKYEIELELESPLCNLGDDSDKTCNEPIGITPFTLIALGVEPKPEPPTIPVFLSFNAGDLLLFFVVGVLAVPLVLTLLVQVLRSVVDVLLRKNQ